MSCCKVTVWRNTWSLSLELFSSFRRQPAVSFNLWFGLQSLVTGLLSRVQMLLPATIRQLQANFVFLSCPRLLVDFFFNIFSLRSIFKSQNRRHNLLCRRKLCLNNHSPSNLLCLVSQLVNTCLQIYPVRQDPELFAFLGWWFICDWIQSFLQSLPWKPRGSFPIHIFNNAFLLTHTRRSMLEQTEGYH